MHAALPISAQSCRQKTPRNAPFASWSMFTVCMGVGTFFHRPISDAFGRKRLFWSPAALIHSGAAIAWASASFEMVASWGVTFQGLGARGRVLSPNRHCARPFTGRQMAQISL